MGEMMIRTINFKKALIYSPILMSSFLFFSCTDVNLFKSGGLMGGLHGSNSNEELNPGGGGSSDDNSAGGGGNSSGDYTYNGKCSIKFDVGRSSSLSPEIKNGDKLCLEYSPKDYQGAGATGATVIIVSAVWCAPCHEYKNHYSQLLDVTEKHKATVKIFLEQSASSSDVAGYGPSEFFVSKDIKALESIVGRIGGFPTTFILDKNGQVKYKQEGFGTSIFSEIDNVLSGL